MAYTHLSYQWPGGEQVDIIVGTDGPDRGYPDQLAETKACALSLYREIVGIVPAPDPEP